MGQSGRDFLKWGGPAILVFAAALFLTSQFVTPAPPYHLAMATGSPDGTSHGIATRYNRILADDGIALEIRPTSGSLEDLNLLTSKRSGVAAALVPGGLGGPESHPGLVSLASVYLEPIWIFYRAGAPLDRLSGLKGGLIAAGSEGSATREFALDLLAPNGLSQPPTRLLDIGGAEAAAALKRGVVDAAIFVASPKSPVVADLLRVEGIRLMSLARAAAYAQASPYLTTVTLAEGVIDLVRNIPPRETTMLASIMTLVARSDLHPALVKRLLRAANAIHGEGGLLEAPGTYPSQRSFSFPASEAATAYLAKGPSFLDRHLPFRTADFVERMSLFLIPVVALALPLLWFLPPIYRWRTRARIYRWYRELRAVDMAIRSKLWADERRRLLSELSRIETQTKMMAIPLSYAEPLYQLRVHIELLRCRLEAPDEEGDVAEYAIGQTSRMGTGVSKEPRIPIDPKLTAPEQRLGS